jgi:hypothetical protein
LISALIIIAISFVLAVGWWGVGRLVCPRSGPAVAVMSGLTVFLFLCATVWLGKIPGYYLMPVIWGYLATGMWVALRRTSPSVLGGVGLGMVLIGTTYALPFAIEPGLLAYAHWGTDQWGYTAVSKWLTLHSVAELPAISEKPGMDWVWQMLVIRDRPLMYTVLAVIASAFGCETVTIYYALPAALVGAVFLILFSSGAAESGRAYAAHFLTSAAVAMQPILWLHFQHQYLAGVVAGLTLIIFALALCENQMRPNQTPLFFSLAVLLGVLFAGLYTITLSGVCLGLLVATFAFAIGRDWVRTRTLGPWQQSAATKAWTVGIGIVSAICLLLIRRAMREPLGLPPGSGAGGHPWAQIGAIFGLTEIGPWYQSTAVRGADGIDPVTYFPAGSSVGIILTVVAVLLFGVQIVRWWRRRADITLLLILAAVFAALAMAASPQSDNIVLSRCVPIFGPLLLVVLGFVAREEPRRWLRWLTVGLACLPAVRAMPGTWRMLASPVNLISEAQWKAPPKGDPWGTAAYLYFYRDRQEIDWSMAPDAYRIRRNPNP